MQEVFNRIEKKYLLDKELMRKLMELINDYIELSEYPFSKICSVYFDTKDKELIRKSIEKPLYKEKIRMRSYGIPSKKDKVFIEIKKKFNGIVTKRRVCITLKEANEYLENHIIPNTNKQIFNELDYCFKRYDLYPSIYVSSERCSYCSKEDKSFRITFDSNIKWRNYDLRLDKGDYGANLINNETYLMEVKTSHSMPLWFVRALSQLQIYPISFSKYGKIYQISLEKNLKIS